MSEDTTKFPETRHASSTDITRVNDPATTSLVFGDPVRYLAGHGIEAELIAAAVMRAAA